MTSAVGVKHPLPDVDSWWDNPANNFMCKKEGTQLGPFFFYRSRYLRTRRSCFCFRRYKRIKST